MTFCSFSRGGKEMQFCEGKSRRLWMLWRETTSSSSHRILKFPFHVTTVSWMLSRPSLSSLLSGIVQLYAAVFLKALSFKLLSSRGKQKSNMEAWMISQAAVSIKSNLFFQVTRWFDFVFAKRLKPRCGGTSCAKFRSKFTGSSRNSLELVRHFNIIMLSTHKDLISSMKINWESLGLKTFPALFHFSHRLLLAQLQR